MTSMPPSPVKRSISPWVVILGFAVVAIALIVIGDWLGLLNEKDPTYGPYGRAVLHTRLRGADLDDISGICMSTIHPGEFWLNEDASGSDKLYRFGVDGELRQRIVVIGVELSDVEDLAHGPLPDGSPTGLFLADTGDERAPGTPPRLVVIDERDTDQGDEVIPVRAVDLLFPNGTIDCESLMISPETGDAFLISKEATGEESTVFRVAYEEWNSESGGPAQVEILTHLDLSGLHSEGHLPHAYRITSADIHPRRESLVVRTRYHLYVFILGGEPEASTFLADPMAITSTRTEPKGEGVCYGLDGRDLFTSSERSQGILRFTYEDGASSTPFPR